MPRTPKAPFWQTKRLADMSDAEWESLCDGCGRCCMNKLEDEDDGRIHLTAVACKLLDLASCRCSDYENRQKKVPDCIRLTPETLGKLTWLPSTCAYRLIDEGHDLPSWHPLKTGDPNTVHEAGISVGWFAKSERRIKPENIANYIIDDFPNKLKNKKK